MLTKAAFFALLNDANNKIGVTAHIAEFAEGDLIIRQNGAPNCALSTHRTHKTTVAAFNKYNAWLNQWFELQAAHAEALEMDLEFVANRCRDAVFFGSLDAFGRRVIVEAAHGEALAMNAAHDEERLNREYRNTMAGINYGPGANERRSAFGQCRRCGAHRDLNDWADNNDCCPVCDPQPTHDDKVIDMNKARAKQQQTAANLPKPQMVDVVRAFLRTTPASQEQIEAVAKVSESELARLIRKFDDKGARITAHLTKSKSAGYGFLTFGYNGQLPPGTYHKMIVANMKNAREVANRYGALMWNF